ncbi:T9SS type A sorting domain-containing protein, partial [bacterium]|nr:T9SS type A sorting domain-containing protein [bacterium]
RCCVPGTDRVWYSHIFIGEEGDHSMQFGSQMYCTVDSNESCAQTVPEIQVNLFWNSGHALDLDLWVTDPTGERCYYANTPTSTGGQLIRDNLCANYENGREEIILWPQNAPLGEYIVEADWFSSCGNQINSQDIEVRASVQGRMIVAQLTMEEDGHVEAMRFVVDSLVSSAPPTPNIPTPAQFSLHQNYPNPFNPSTTISFELARAANITLSVYDVLGREVARLADGKLASGLHTIEWNCANCATGVYLIELKGESFREVKKAMLLR